MTFVSLPFVGLFALVAVLAWTLPVTPRKVALLLASLVFYGWVHPAWLLLLVGGGLIDHACGLVLARRPRWWVPVAVSAASNLGMLLVFKYFDFFSTSVRDAAALVGWTLDTPTLDMLLPAGLSFFALQGLGYVVDVYRGEAKAEPSRLTYLCFHTFFPQLVAGPISRASSLMPQFDRRAAWDWASVADGASLAAWGAFKKVVIADTLAPYVDALFGAAHPAPVMAWAGALGFMVQMLCDFSAYSDLARGVARMIGFEVALNFDHPYLAGSPDELWERWHITFSKWLRYYVFVPLTRLLSRTKLATRPRIQLAILLTMLVSGFWHGAAWHFVLWGVYWGVLQVGWTPVKGAPRPARVALMVALTWFGHLLFREPSLARLAGYLAAPPWAGTFEERVLAALAAALAVVGAAILVVAWQIELRVLPVLRARGWMEVVAPWWWVIAAAAVFVFARQTRTDFLYFQF